MTRYAAALFALLCLTAHAADADADWQNILAMDQAAPEGQWKSREEARTATIQFLAKQEVTLRSFIAAHPGDPHELDAQLRLAHLLATRADLEQDSRLSRQAEAIFAALERDPKFQGRRADVEFARLSLFMQRGDAASAANRGALLARARKFASEFPSDHRIAALFAEVASAFEDEPKTARALLEQARPLADSAELRARIGDDLKRLEMLGKPLEMKWTSVRGEPVDLEKLRGKVVLIYFFASWSAPSMAELDWVRRIGDSDPRIRALGICLDSDPVAVPSLLGDHGIKWPVYCDGAGWAGPVVRGFGINSLPALWIVDRDGILRALDARQDAVALIERLLSFFQRFPKPKNGIT